MKNSKFLKISIIALLPIFCALGVIFSASNNEVESVNAYDGVQLPTTIDLNDSSDSQIRGYYSSLNSLSSSERKGKNLLKNLKDVLSDGQKYYNYDSGDLVWKMYEITDRDWDKSPASSTIYGTYNKATNTITNYVYGSNSNPKNDPYVRAYYMDRNQENVVKVWGNHTQDGTGINREHLWAKAEGFDGKGAAGARGDPMHLVAANGYANNIHSNYFYGYVDKSKDYEDVKDKYDTLGHNFSGKSATFPSSWQTVFEPQDCDKGDIARAIFYMAARYNNIAGKTASEETFDADNPNLLLTDDLSKWKSSGYTSTATNSGYHGLVTDLLEWNRIDPPDEYEIHRNNLLYTNFTNNRNPFIDFPDWADIAFGNSTSSANPATDAINGVHSDKQLSSIAVTTQPSKVDYVEGNYFDPTGMVVKAYYDDGTSTVITDYTYTPNGKLTTSDKTITISYQNKSTTVNISVKSSIIHVNSVTISPLEAELEIGNSKQLSVTVLPIDATEKGITWSSSNSSIVAVDSSGRITGRSAGNATITAISKDNGSIKGTCAVHVLESEVLDRIEVSGTYKTNYFKGDTFSTEGIQVFAYYKQGGIDVRSEDVTDEVEFSEFDSSIVGTCSVKVTYNNISTSFNVVINEAPVEENTVNFSVSGQGYTNAQKIYSITNENFVVNFDAKDSTQAAYYSTGDAIRVYHDTSFTISGPKKIIEISFTYSPKDDRGENIYTVNEGTVDPITGYWSNINGSDSVTFTLTNSDIGHRKIQNIKVKYDPGQVTEVILQSVKVSGSYATRFYQGDEFSSEGLVLTAYYNNGTSKEVEPTSISGYDMSTVGPQNVVVSYTEKNVTRFDIYSITIAARYVVGITIEGQYKTTFFINEDFSHDGLVVKAIYNTDYVEDVTNSCTISEPSTSTLGTKTVSISYNGFEITYEINVISLVPKSLTIAKEPNKTEYFVGETFSSEGIEVSCVYTNNTSREVEPDTYTGYDMSKEGAQTVTVSYTENNVTVTDTFTIIVNSIDLVSVDITSEPTKITYFVGDEFSSEGLVVLASFNDGSSRNVNPTSITGYDMSEVGNQIVTVSVTISGITKEDTFEILVKSIDLVSINITSEPAKTTYFVGDEFSSEGLVVLANFNDGSSRNVNPTSITGYDMSKVGNQIVTVSVTISGITKEDTFEITVEAVEEVVLSSISLSGNYQKEFFKGEDFSSDGLIVTATYSDESTKVVTPTNITGYSKITTGEQTITVTYVEDEISVSATYKINVKSVDLVSIEISGDFKKEYEYGENLSTEGLIVIAYYSNGSSKVVIPSLITGYSAAKVGYQVITVSYQENGITKSTTYQVKVKALQEEPEQSSNVGIIAGVAGGIVGVGGLITTIGIVVHKKHKKVK